MKTALIALLAIACSANMFAGTLNTFNGGSTLPLPDGGVSALLLGMGLSAVGLARRIFRR